MWRELGARGGALLCAIGRVVFGRANQKFDMPREIRHDERMELSVSCSQESMIVKTRAASPVRKQTGVKSPPPSFTRKDHQRALVTPWPPREFTSNFSVIIPRAQCHPASVPSLYLDPQIRDWVLFPITLVMVRPS